MNDIVPAEFDQLVEEAAATLRQGQSDLLAHFWRLGELFERFLQAAAAGSCAGRTARSFAEALRERGQEVTVAQLQQAKRIFDRYQADELPALVERGFTITHLKALLPLDEALRERVENEAVGEDGRARSTRELREVVKAARIDALGELPPETGIGADQPGVAARGARAPSAVVGALDDGSDDDGGPVVVADAEPEAAPLPDRAPPVSDIRVGAVPTREYSKPPLAVIKRATGAAEALADVLPNLWTALAEAERIGFDSDRAQQNFRDQAELLITAFEGLRQVAPAAIQRLQAATR